LQLRLSSQREGATKHRIINALKKQLNVMQSASRAVAKDNASKWNKGPQDTTRQHHVQK